MIAADYPVLGRRYQLQQLLDRGAMGSVYRAHDRLTGQVVALKHVRRDTDGDDEDYSTTLDSRLALAAEFRLLASLRHPNVISVLDYGFDADGLPYYTMDLLPNARTMIEAGRDMPFEAQIGLLVQLLQALAYMHQRGIVHHDLKPRNVLVTGGTVHVLDFGLSTLFEHASRGETIGTIAYMAPEVLRGEAITRRVDLYAVGVMAYEILAGRHPFLGPDTNATIRNTLESMPDLLNSGLDMRVAVILDRLLSKDPDDRHSSASALIAEFNRLLSEPVAIETAATRESFLQAARFVGREQEFALLSDALHQALDSRGSAWLVGGESGVGKSRLLDEVATLAMVRGALVLRGQAVESGGSPFQVWRAPLRWLGLLSELDSDDVTVLARVLPEIVAAHGLTLSDDTTVGSGRQLQRVVEHLLAAQPQPVVLILEDLQWSGSESLSLLENVAPSAARLPLLIIGSYRDDERPDLPSALKPLQVLRLPRLTDESIADLSEAMLGIGGRSPAVVELLSQETEGNVFFLIEIVRALAEEAGRLDRVSAMTLPEHVFAGGIDRIVQRRLQAVPTDARALLKLAAVAGRELDPALLRHLAPDVRTERWLSVCVDAAVIEYRDGQWRFGHDKLRHGLLNSLDGDERRDLHGRVATGLEAVYDDSAGHYAALSYHWAQAGIPAKEADYAGLAGQEALRSSAYREAIHFVGRALSVQSARPPSWEARLYRILGEAHAAVGHYAEAIDAFERALAIARSFGDTALESDLYYALGDVVYVLERFEDAEAYYRASLERCRTLEDANGIMRALNSLGNVAYDLDDYDKANDYYKQSLALSREHGSRWGMAGSFGDDVAGEESAD